jgi:hypothetical protein
MSTWVEIRPSTKRTEAPILVPEETANTFTGFRSVFSFPEAVAKEIRHSGNMAGLSEKELSCSTLFLDFDDDPKAEDEAEEWLRDHKIGFESYFTGNRGKHLHVPIETISGNLVLPSVKGFVRDIFPNADDSIYKASGIFRLPGTYHEKNPGQRKLLLHAVPGAKLRIEQKEQFPMPLVAVGSTLTSNEQFLAALFRPVEEGGRNTKFFVLGCLAKDIGLTLDEAYDVALNYNSTNCWPPLDAHEVFSATRSAYGGGFRK